MVKFNLKIVPIKTSYHFSTHFGFFQKPNGEMMMFYYTV